MGSLLESMRSSQQPPNKWFHPVGTDRWLLSATGCQEVMTGSSILFVEVHVSSQHSEHWLTKPCIWWEIPGHHTDMLALSRHCWHCWHWVGTVGSESALTCWLWVGTALGASACPHAGAPRAAFWVSRLALVEGQQHNHAYAKEGPHQMSTILLLTSIYGQSFGVRFVHVWTSSVVILHKVEFSVVLDNIAQVILCLPGVGQFEQTWAVQPIHAWWFSLYHVYNYICNICSVVFFSFFSKLFTGP